MGRIQAKLLIRGSDMIVINAPHLASGVSITSPKLLGRVVVIPNGVDTDGQLSPDGKETERQPGPARVVYYTNGGPAKNEADFLRIVRASPATLFRAVGNTSGLQGNLNLELRGWREPIASELRWADVVLNTSLSEGSPNFCLQGLALGRSVIGFDNGGILDLARQWPEFVTVVPFGDTEAAVHAIHCSQLDGQRGRAAVPSVASVSREWDVRLSGLVENRYLGFGRAAMRNP
jgi:glycosyltransferase involved in cell wall biosynthesis